MPIRPTAVVLLVLATVACRQTDAARIIRTDETVAR
jgi:hypothetical protein